MKISELPAGYQLQQIIISPSFKKGDILFLSFPDKNIDMEIKIIKKISYKRCRNIFNKWLKLNEIPARCR